jgi:tRNA (guanine37-N1)-methyltransferase
MMTFDIVTIFPAMIEPQLTDGVLGRAAAAGVIDVKIHDLRDFTTDRHRVVDDTPYGGGPGMVLKPDPIFRALDAIEADRRLPLTVVLTSPQGTRFTQTEARRLSQCRGLVILCGRYEGFDERIRERVSQELSIGDYVLTGGELPAAIIMDATTRLLPGVLGNEASSAYESFGVADLGASEEGEPPRSTHGSGGLLDYPHYTRPAEFRGLTVPDVLCGGDHAAIRKWRREQALLKTMHNRPDLLKEADLGIADRRFLERAKEKENA